MNDFYTLFYVKVNIRSSLFISTTKKSEKLDKMHKHMKFRREHVMSSLISP